MSQVYLEMWIHWRRSEDRLENQTWTLGCWCSVSRITIKIKVSCQETWTHKRLPFHKWKSPGCPGWWRRRQSRPPRRRDVHSVCSQCSAAQRNQRRPPRSRTRCNLYDTCLWLLWEVILYKNQTFFLFLSFSLNTIQHFLFLVMQASDQSQINQWSFWKWRFWPYQRAVVWQRSSSLHLGNVHLLRQPRPSVRFASFRFQEWWPSRTRASEPRLDSKQSMKLCLKKEIQYAWQISFSS